MKNNQKLYNLALLLITKSLKLKKGEKVFIHNQDTDAGEFMNYLHRVCIEKGASRVNIWWDTEEIRENIFYYGKKNQTSSLLDGLEEQIRNTDVYIKIKSGKIIQNFQGDHVLEYNNKMRPLLNLYSNSDIRRVLFYYPGKNLAKRIGKSQKETFDIMYKACVLTNWEDVKKSNLKLLKKIEKTNLVKIIGKSTNLTFSIKNIPTLSAHGERNMPDGEVFTAPVRTSVNGKILFDLPTHFNGITFNSIRLIVKNGKIIKATCAGIEKTKILNKIIDSHEQNRYFGEFAIGTNKNIKNSYKLTIFDEKIYGTIHMAIGRCYDRASNQNNKATIHWDLIKNMKYSGSEIYFDDKIVFKDGEILI